MTWLSSSLTNLKVQLNSLIKDEDELCYSNIGAEKNELGLFQLGDPDIAENIDKNALSGTSFHEGARPYHAGLHQFLKYFDYCLKDVSSLNSSLNYFAEQMTDIFDQVDYMRFELENTKYENHSPVKMRNTTNRVVDTNDINFRVKEPISVEMNCMPLDSSPFKCTYRASERRHTETLSNKENEFCSDNFSSIDFTRHIENLILAFETAREKQRDLEKRMRTMLFNACSIEAVELLLVDYFICAEENYAVWEKLKLMFVLPAIAKFKNTKISELSVPDSVKEVFQPNFTTVVTHSSPIHREVGELNVETKESVVTSSTNVSTKSKDDATATHGNDCTSPKEYVSSELSRLRSHLLSVEQAYTNELLQCEDEMKILRTQLYDTEQKLNTMSQSYTSMNVRTNRIIESLHDDAKRFAEDKENLDAQLKSCQAELRRSLNDSQNLRSALDLFYKNKDSEICQATEKLQSEIKTIQRENDDLHEAVRILRHTLSNRKETFTEGKNFKSEFEKKEEEICFLKSEVRRLDTQLRQAETKITEWTSDVEVKTKINLIKNVVFRYITSHSSTTKMQSLRILTDVLDFNDYEKYNVGLRESGSERVIRNDQTLIGEFIKFMEKESCPKVEKGVEKVESSVYSLPVSTPTPNTSRTPCSATSSSILKDALHSIDT